MKLQGYQLPPTYHLSSPGCGCAGEPPGHPRYFVRHVYTSHGNSPPYNRPQLEYRGQYFAKLEEVDKLFKPLPLEHERVQAWIADTFSHHRHCYQDPTVDGSWSDKMLIYPVPDYRLEHLHDDPRFSEKWRTAEKAQTATANAEIEAHAAEVATPDNHDATILVRRYYPQFTPTDELISNPTGKIGNWWSTGDRPKPEDCPGQYDQKHPVNGKWCQWCGWCELQNPTK